MAMQSFAQQQLGQRPRVTSPVINTDGSVTFNFYDPTAQKVSVSGDFEEIRNRRLEMQKRKRIPKQASQTRILPKRSRSGRRKIGANC